MQLGYASGYTSELFGDFVLYEETECLAKGDRHCRIVGKPLKQWENPEPLTKYFKAESVADRLLELQTQVEQLRASLNSETSGEQLIGESASFKQALEMITKAAPSQVTLMLLGETGVGKEMFARELHRISNRSQGPFVTVNCAAIPETLIESELFGVEKGAFSGVSKSRPADSNGPTGVPYFWTKSVSFLPLHKQSCCASYRKVRLNESAISVHAKSTFELSSLPIAIWRRASRLVISGPTFIIGSIPTQLPFRRFAIDSPTSLCWRITLLKVTRLCTVRTSRA